MAIGWIVFALVFGSALLAMYAHCLLPEHHLSSNSENVVKLGIALIATMSALVLMSLLVASANSAFDMRSNQLTQASADVLLLDSALARYGPEKNEARALLKSAMVATLERFEGTKKITIDPGRASPIEVIYDKIEALKPQSEQQRSMQSQALTLATEAVRTKLLVFESLGASIPVPFLVVLVFWLCIIFASFGLFAPRNATVITVLCVCALSVAGAIFLILELDQSFEGLLEVSSAPVRAALAQLGRFSMRGFRHPLRVFAELE